jgi:hypothetical protein
MMIKLFLSKDTFDCEDNFIFMYELGYQLYQSDGIVSS